MLGRYSGVELRLYSIETQGRLWPYAVLLPPLSRGETVITDSDGASLPVRLPLTLRLVGDAIKDRLSAKSLESRLERSLDRIGSQVSPRVYDAANPPLYLWTDFCFGITAGGSVGHAAGVLNNLREFAGPPLFVTTDPIPTVDDSVETHVIRPGSRHRNSGELRMAAFNETIVPAVQELLGERRPGFIYHRHSRYNFGGLDLADRFSVPFVLEYNGSFVWMSNHWGDGVSHEALLGKIELANLHGADLIVAGAEPLRDEIVERGIDPEKIVVIPTSVNTDVYTPEVDGREVRRKLGLEGKTVVGFVGTFGAWHGAEVLADAFGLLLKQAPDLCENVRLLMVGDGRKMPEVVANLEHHGVRELAVLTGLVPQAEGPAHLAACDVLASPHIPNTDGTPFFGSPTKLFEYMSMGGAIVASDLDQIGEVLEHDRTAVLVAPGDPGALADGLERLIRDPELRIRLGRAVRQVAVEHHSWREHTRRIVEALRDRCEPES